MMIFAKILAVAALSGAPIISANASAGVKETSEPETSIVSSEPAASDADDEVSEEEKQKIIDEVKSWLSQYLDSDLVERIITWCVDGGIMSALVVVYVKYRKYKAMSSTEIAAEVKETATKALQEEFKKLSDEEVANIMASVDSMQATMDKMMKALVLAQDKTAEGKIALMKLISESTEDEAVQEAAEKVEETVKEEETAKEEAKEKVGSDYTPID